MYMSLKFFIILLLYMDIDELKIIKKIGSGMNGTVYLVKNNLNKQFALKTENIRKLLFKKTSSSQIWREIKFSTDFGNKHKKKFIKMYGYDFKVSKEDPNYICIRRVYELIDGTLNDILNTLTQEQMHSFVLQLTSIILLLHENGYCHCDIHLGNIGYVKTTKKYINKIKTYGYIYKLIDYGHMKNNKNKLNFSNKIAYNLGIIMEKILVNILNALYYKYNINIEDIIKVLLRERDPPKP